MPDAEHDNGSSDFIDAIAHDVGTLSELHDELTEVPADRAALTGFKPERKRSFVDGVYRAIRCLRILRRQERVQPVEIVPGACRLSETSRAQRRLVTCFHCLHGGIEFRLV